MKHIREFLIIMAVTLAGEILKYFIPLPIPASIYGLVIMLILLCAKIVKIDDVKEAGGFLIEIMPLMFIPAAVGLMVIWSDVQNTLIKVFFVAFITTWIVMIVTGKVTEAILKSGGTSDESINS